MDKILLIKIIMTSSKHLFKFSYCCDLLTISCINRYFSYHTARSLIRKRDMRYLIGLTSIIRRYYGISNGYFLGHWCISKVSTIYISSIAMDICDFFINIKNIHTIHLTILFLSNLIIFWSVQTVLKFLM